MDLVLKADSFMASVAEGFVGGVAAAAQGNHGAAGEAEGLALWVENLEVAFDTDGAVAIDGDFRCGHSSLSFDESSSVAHNAELRTQDSERRTQNQHRKQNIERRTLWPLCVLGASVFFLMRSFFHELEAGKTQRR